MYKQCKDCKHWTCSRGIGPREGEGTCGRVSDRERSYVQGDLEWMLDYMTEKRTTREEEHCQFMLCTTEGLAKNCREAAKEVLGDSP